MDNWFVDSLLGPISQLQKADIIYKKRIGLFDITTSI
jgi:hypothetical protein